MISSASGAFVVVLTGTWLGMLGTSSSPGACAVAGCLTTMASEASIPMDAGSSQSALSQSASSQSALESVAASFAGFWAEGDMPRLRGLLTRTGIRIQIGEVRGTLVSRPQAEAAIRDLVRGHRSGTATLSRAQDAGGTPPRGFAEIQWRAVAEGTSEVILYTVFVGFVREEEGWMVTEVRVLR